MSTQHPNNYMQMKIELASLYLLPWLSVLLYSFYLKFVMLEWDGFRIFSRQVGRIELADLNFVEKALFYKSDIAVGCVFAPVLIFLFAFLAPRKFRGLGVVIVCLSSIILMFIQHQSFLGLGSFTSANMFFSSVEFALLHPEEISNYIKAKSLFKFIALLGVFAISIWYSTRAQAQKNGFVYRVIIRRLPFILFGGILIIMGVLWSTPSTPPNMFHRSVLVTTFSTFIGGEGVDTLEFKDLTAKELIDEYRSLSLSPIKTSRSGFFGKAEDYDVIFYVIETLPASFLDMRGSLDGLSTLKMLKEQAFIGIEHYSTYPYTNRALFSIFSSLYPSSGKKSFLHQRGQLRAPGLARSLAEEGYFTGVFSPTDLKFEADDDLFRSLGFQDHQFPAEGGVREESWQNVKAKDLEALNQLIREVDHLSERNKRYLAVFIPQISHGPWPDISEQQNLKTLEAKGMSLLSLQDSWLGKIVSVLEDNARLDKTIIVVVSDHGFRTRVDYPKFSGGVVDKVSFHVPLLIYAPGVVVQPQEIPWMTSHIDIAPTVLNLLGITSGREFEQGLSIWEPDLNQRRLFFFGHYFFGADGFGSVGNFYMWNRLFDNILAADALTFNNIDSTRKASTEEASQARDLIGRIGSLQHAIIERLAVDSIRHTIHKKHIDNFKYASEAAQAKSSLQRVTQ